MKKFLGIMALIFGGLAIYLFIDSAKDVGLSFQVANIQETVFCAACAVLCAMNIIGAIIIESIESQSRLASVPAQKEDKPADNQQEPIHTPETIVASGKKEILFCDICGMRHDILNKVMYQTRKGPQEKMICDKCMEENKEKLV